MLSMRLMKICFITSLMLTLSCALVCVAEQAESSPSLIRIDHAGLKKLSWQLLCQASMFRDLTVMEMLEILHTNGFHHIELSPGQSLSSVHDKDIKVGPDMGPADLEMLSAKLKDVHLDIVSYGVAEFGHSEADARKVFEFAKGLNVKNIIAAPPANSLEMLDKLATEYAINVAILNQPGSPSFADGDALLQAIKERSMRIGVCADIIEWRRTGQDPVDCVRKLKGRIFEVHLKDSNSPQEAAAISDVLKELAQQKFKGAFCVQTTTGSGPELLKHLAAVVNSFSDIVSKLAATVQ
jgi:sugar phosphate isomerase/epimerase